MAGVSVDAGGSKRRSLDAQVNMIPMIDLFVAMISFLLITAVWTSTGQVQAQQPSRPTDSPDLTPTEQLRITLSPTGLRVGHNAADMHEIAAGHDQLQHLRDRLGEIRRADASGREVWIEPDSAVNYNDIIRVMDTVYDAWNGPPRAGHARSEAVTVRLM
jgi:biopolymer transport protein ExbD